MLGPLAKRSVARITFLVAMLSLSAVISRVWLLREGRAMQIYRTLLVLLLLSGFHQAASAYPLERASLSAHGYKEPPENIDPYAIPLTPVGKQLTWVLQCVNKGAAPDAEGRFTKRFLEQFTVKEVQELLSSLRERAFGGDEVMLVEPDLNARRDAMTCIVGVEATERYLSLLLLVDEETGLIAGLTFAAGLSGQDESDSDMGVWEDLAGEMGSLQSGVWFGAYEILESGVGADRDVRIADSYEFGGGKRLHITSVARVYVLLAAAEKAMAAGGDILATKVVSGGERVTQESVGEALFHAAAGEKLSSDAILTWVGRNVVERTVQRWQEEASASLPFMMFSEYQWLHLKAPPGLLDQYISEVDPSERRAFLESRGAVRTGVDSIAQENRAQVLGLSAGASLLWERPKAIQQVGWFSTNRELAYAMAQLYLIESSDGGKKLKLAECWRAPQPPLVHRASEPELATRRPIAAGEAPGAGGVPAVAGSPAGVVPGAPEVVPPLAMQPVQAAAEAPLDGAIWKDSLMLTGAEPGVATLAYLLHRDDGRWFTLVMTWNNDKGALDEPRLYELARRGLEILAKEGREPVAEPAPEALPEATPGAAPKPGVQVPANQAPKVMPDPN